MFQQLFELVRVWKTHTIIDGYANCVLVYCYVWHFCWQFAIVIIDFVKKLKLMSTVHCEVAECCFDDTAAN